MHIIKRLRHGVMCMALGGCAAVDSDAAVRIVEPTDSIQANALETVTVDFPYDPDILLSEEELDAAVFVHYTDLLSLYPTRHSITGRYLKAISFISLDLPNRHKLCHSADAEDFLFFFVEDSDVLSVVLVPRALPALPTYFPDGTQTLPYYIAPNAIAAATCSLRYEFSGESGQLIRIMDEHRVPPAELDEDD